MAASKTDAVLAHLQEVLIGSVSGEEAGASGEEADASGVVGVGQTDRKLLVSGEITQEEYTARLVQSATRHLEGALSADRLAEVRELMQAQVALEPELKALAERAAQA